MNALSCAVSLYFIFSIFLLFIIFSLTLQWLLFPYPIIWHELLMNCSALFFQDDWTRTCFCWSAWWHGMCNCLSPVCSRLLSHLLYYTFLLLVCFCLVIFWLFYLSWMLRPYMRLSFTTYHLYNKWPRLPGMLK